MCKTCGCGEGAAMQLELHVKSAGEKKPLQILYVLLMGAPGILHVKVDDISGQVLADYSPLKTSKQDLENFVIESGYEVVSAQVRELEHQHGVVAFLKRVLGK